MNYEQQVQPGSPVMNKLFVAAFAMAGSVLASGLLVIAAAGRGAAEQQKPNILFCLADDWGWPHAGAYGDQVVKTPAFDRLATEGVLFQYAYVSSPSCTPCRNSILTGQQFYRLGQGANLWSTLDVKHPNFMFLLREAGYQIGHWRKAWGPGDFRAAGYTESPVGPQLKFTDFIRQRDKSKPFCFWFGTSDPHRGYVKGSGAASGIPVDKVRVPAFYPNQAEVRGDVADYYFEVQRWDRDVAAAMGLLETEGELDNTIIVMSGDHGMPFPRCKGNLYDWGAHVPLAIRWGAQAKAGRLVSDFTSLTDLAPTFLEAAGVQIPESMTGKSLLTLLTGTDAGRVDPGRDFVVFGRERHTPAQKMPSIAGYPARAIRTDRWLLILNLEPDRWPAGVPDGATHPFRQFSDCDGGPTKKVIMHGKEDARLSRFYDLCFGKRGAVELYDCETDPDQVHNLAGDPQHSETIGKLREQLIWYLQKTADPRFTDAAVEFDDYPYRVGYLKPHPTRKGH
jgi:arylsulfatase A-like enzyme